MSTRTSQPAASKASFTIVISKRTVFILAGIILLGGIFSFSYRFVANDEDVTSIAIDNKDYDFDRMVPMVFGPELMNVGEQGELQVAVVAIDRKNQPVVTYNGASLQNAQNGLAKIPVKAMGSEMVLRGKVSITDNKGKAHSMNWIKSIKVMRPQGTISLPESNILYRGYNNQIEGVASGYDETVLLGEGIVLTRNTGYGYSGKITTSGDELGISIAGKSAVTNRTVTLGVFTYRVSNLPDGTIMLGTAGNGDEVTGSESVISVKTVAPGLQNIVYTVKSWELNCGALHFSGTGEKLSAEALAAIKKEAAGKTISLLVSYKTPDDRDHKGSLVLHRK